MPALVFQPLFQGRPAVQVGQLRWVFLSPAQVLHYVRWEEHRGTSNKDTLSFYDNLMSKLPSSGFRILDKSSIRKCFLCYGAGSRKINEICNF